MMFSLHAGYPAATVFGILQSWVSGYLVAQLVEALCYKLEGCRVRFLMLSLEFFVDTILPASLLPCG
jgi:hypothetical protein